jgi:DNA-binding MarR family transcriptional regulator
MRNVNGLLDQSELKKYAGYLLARARWQAFRAFEQNIGKPLQLRRVEFSILVLLQSNEQVTAAQLAQALGVAAPNMTGILRRLEERKLIARLRAEADKRSQAIALTPHGQALAGAAVDGRAGHAAGAAGQAGRACPC